MQEGMKFGRISESLTRNERKWKSRKEFCSAEDLYFIF